MTQTFLHIYDYFCKHKRTMFAILMLTIPLMLLLVSHVHFKEDISDFLPLNSRDQEAMRIYQNVSGANKILALVGSRDTSQTDADVIVGAVDQLVSGIKKNTGLPASAITAQVDMDRVEQSSSFVYSHIPYFLTPADYQRMEQLLQDKDYVAQQLVKDKQMLLFPSGSMLSSNISRDPLNLFTPVVQKLSSTSSKMNYELYDGYVFTPDMKYAIVVINSPYGSSETEHNAELISKIEKAKQATERNNAVSIHLTGGPVIAVGNAQCIKTDSVLSVTIAIVLILLILGFTFRNVWNILLIAISIAWGWLFALAGLSLINSNMSVIVIGISSVIIGIAINYPLHLIAHLSHTPDMRKALKEILAPLLVGNITTIGAFLTLVPLKSIALRDLGLFASFLLLGTILFVLIFLPHIVSRKAKGSHQLLNKIGNISIDKKPWLIVGVAVLTVILGFFSVRVGFDSNLSHINYMSKAQKQDMAYLSKLQKNVDSESQIYVVSEGASLDEALMGQEKTQKILRQIPTRNSQISGMGQFACSRATQSERLKTWNKFVSEYKKIILSELISEASKQGFSGDSFNEFYRILSAQYKVENPANFTSFYKTAFSSNIAYDDVAKTFNVINVITLPKSSTDEALTWVEKHIDDADHYHFEISRLNSVVANSLSNNFNYIGYACGFIVFFFLWFSFGNIELAALSFLPMAVSWIWILGLMGMTGTEFNIVNIILATFIFGQGDDYTIFMTEGCQYEYAFGRKMLASYKNSILISALIMFIGMGALIFARHPALHSLAVVNIIGMFSVVLMAWILPPFVFRWMVSKHGSWRKRPLTVKSLLMPKRYPQTCAPGLTPKEYITYVKDVYYYCGVDIVKTVKKALNHYDDYIQPQDDNTLAVKGGSYGAVALLASLLYPDKTIVTQTIDEDDRAVCEHVACRVANKIKMVNNAGCGPCGRPQ